MKSIRVNTFDLRYSVESAQPLTFFGDISEDGKHVKYVAGSSLIDVRQKGDLLICNSQPKIGDAILKREIEKRFGIKDDMQRIYERISTDKFIAESIAKYPGMRVTQNEPWETTICFVISQFNNVKRIRGIVKKLIDTYGDIHTFKVGPRFEEIRSFPRPEVLAAQSVKELMKCGTGFRAKYIKGVAEQCADSFSLDKLYKKGYDDAKEQLMTLPGIGDKVADCILLMGYKKLNAFPVDTWIKRIVERVYFNGRPQSIRTIHSFADEQWGELAGVAQQYIFWHGRSIKLN